MIQLSFYYDKRYVVKPAVGSRRGKAALAASRLSRRNIKTNKSQLDSEPGTVAQQQQQQQAADSRLSRRNVKNNISQIPT